MMQARVASLCNSPPKSVRLSKGFLNPARANIGHAERSRRSSCAFSERINEGLSQADENLSGRSLDADATARSSPASASAPGPAIATVSIPQRNFDLRRVWDDIPSRGKLTIACALSLMLSNMDKVNLTLAILPMAEELGWSATTTGIAQSSVFYGYMLLQLPGGAMCSKIGGRHVLPAGVSAWSLATFLVPPLSGSFVPFCMSRVALGLGAAVAPTAIVDMLGKSVPKEERASAISTSFGGMHVGSIVGLLAAPPIINSLGWRWVFYIFGAAGALWWLFFEGLMDSLERDEPEAAAKLIPVPSADSESGEIEIPYRAMLRCRPLQVVAASQFCHNWFHYTMLAWLPTYFVSALNVDLMHAAQTALLPPIAGIAASAGVGYICDTLISGGMETAHVRKLVQNIAFMFPSLMLLGMCSTPCTPDDSFMSVALITLALGISSFSLGGIYCTHQDLSPKYASTLMGMTNMVAAVPGVIGVAIVGAVYERTQSWELSLFMPSGALLLVGAAIYTLGSSHNEIDFDAEDNSPFAIEEFFKPIHAQAGHIHAQAGHIHAQAGHTHRNLWDVAVAASSSIRSINLASVQEGLLSKFQLDEHFWEFPFESMKHIEPAVAFWPLETLTGILDQWQGAQNGPSLGAAPKICVSDDSRNPLQEGETSR